MIGRGWFEKAFPHAERTILKPIGEVIETGRAIRTRARITFVRQREAVHRRFPAPIDVQPGPRVLAVVTHVADPAREASESVERLERTLDGLLASLAHTRLRIVVNTVSDRHVTAALPEHQRSRISVHGISGVDPMYLGFCAQDEFERQIDEADWFLYLEDDLVLSDSLFIEKLAYFNSVTPDEALLIPNRYELWNGRKIYVDNVWRPELAWNRLTQVEVADWRFAELENPHGGCYCLSQAQLRRWLEAGRSWYGLVSFVGPRESAATGCLQECFRLYKPHAANSHFLEIRHWGTTYAEALLKRGVIEESRTPLGALAKNPAW